ncbi:glycogen debranching protein GlgX [Brachybacterium saurashtrense]|uniref:Glycogen debranching enzyme GlgX n=1 Tax=Brachybacterium saurashtrense TaxID=556288 RepID=A0A345YN78_9MICO|nr:glycogen debranching protein GlgX [Brachybacterium saurashtrense]AXK45380.1 glycogen debranching enzyme GlgX [Brachybacterium saurashtrense]RRR21863.1 glycogen debranching enzyme GlgX [Brachybacterium saurashtrense]
MPADRDDRLTPPCAPTSPGLVVDEQGRGTFAVAAPRAEAVDLCIRRGSTEQRRRLRHVDGGLHWDHVTGMIPGTRYGLRALGPWAPADGLLCSPHRLLQDPRARGVSHSSPLLSSFFPSEVDAMLDRVGDPARRAEADNGDDAVWSVVVSDAFDWQEDRRPRIGWDATVLYELHVKGFTQLHPAVPPEQRGTYAGLAHPAVLDHLRSLGVTSLELLPVHAAMDEPHLTRLGLTNYWGYSTMSYFAPEPSLATAAAQAAGAQAVVDEVKAMVRTLHAEGFEVILDVVYNHTAEGGADGPALSLRGLDNLEHYWTDHGRFVDVTGTGGTLDPRSLHVMDLILSSLRYWVQEMHVDGFRFDLAATLGRDDHGFRPDHPLLRAIATDPVLRDVKLIAEPWDVGTDGWQTGRFPVPFAEWNDAFRDDVRSFWLSDRGLRERTGTEAIGGVRDLATRMAGSSDLFTARDPLELPAGRSLRAPWASINYVTAHDGLTLRDLTVYETKRNEANGEDNRDGTSDNRSYHHGHEGELPAGSPEAAVLEERRRRTARSILATLLLGSGTPMLTAGDERGRTQQGNNNAYCQDNEISWVHWDRSRAAEALQETTAHLLRLRREHPQLRTPHFLRPADPAAPDADQVAWFGADGRPLTHEEWMDPSQHLLGMLRPARRGHPGAEHLLVLLSSGAEPLRVPLPAAPWPQGDARVVMDTALESPTLLDHAPLDDRTVTVGPGAVVVVAIAADPAGSVANGLS